MSNDSEETSIRVINNVCFDSLFFKINHSINICLMKVKTLLLNCGSCNIAISRKYNVDKVVQIFRLKIISNFLLGTPKDFQLACDKRNVCNM